MRARVNGVELYFDIDGYGLHVRGDRLVEKPVLAVLHGGPGLDHTDLPPWLRPLTDDMQLLYVDHRGNGRSQRLDPAECRPEAMAADLEALRVELGLGPINVLGISFGGTVALLHSFKYPSAVERLVVSSTLTSFTFLDDARRLARERGTPAQVEAVEELFAGAFRDEEHMNTSMQRLRPLYYHSYSPELDRTRQWTTTNVDLVNWYFANEARTFDLRPLLHHIPVPTLVLTGRHDWICPPVQSQPLVELLPDVRQVMFEGSGHIPLKEENQKFLAAVRSFIVDRELPGGTGSAAAPAINEDRPPTLETRKETER